MAYQYPRKERMQAVRALSTAAFIVLGFAAFGLVAFLTSFDIWRFVGLVIVGVAVASPFALKFHRLTKGRLDASR